jgi:protein required for attachment to host cells
MPARGEGRYVQPYGGIMNVRVVVAGEREATFFDLASTEAAPQARGALLNEVAGLKDQDLETDRPGRRFGGTHGNRHAVDGERSTERHELEQFARAVARTLDSARTRDEFDRLVLIAAPRMLGLLREALPDTCRSVVAAEVPKDFVRHDPSTIRDVIPREAFFH